MWNAAASVEGKAMNRNRGNVIGGATQMIRVVAAASLAFACGSAGATAMTKEDYKAAKQPIAEQYQVERQKCGARHGNAADLCIARAHGARDVAKAELEAAYKPGPRTNYIAAIARTRAAYAIAKEECDSQRGAARKRCVEDAKAEMKRARAQAKSVAEVS